MKVDGLPPDASVRVRCLQGCGHIGNMPNNAAARLAAEHYLAAHPGIRVVILGQHYEVLEPPIVCDTCDQVIEPPFWVHRSDPPTSVGVSVDEDGIWITCDACHELWANGKLSDWVRRTWRIAQEQSPFLKQADAKSRDAATMTRATIAQRFQLLKLRWDEGYRTDRPPPTSDDAFRADS